MESATSALTLTYHCYWELAINNNFAWSVTWTSSGVFFTPTWFSLLVNYLKWTRVNLTAQALCEHGLNIQHEGSSGSIKPQGVGVPLEGPTKPWKQAIYFKSSVSEEKCTRKPIETSVNLRIYLRSHADRLGSHYLRGLSFWHWWRLMYSLQGHSLTASFGS